MNTNPKKRPRWLKWLIEGLILLALFFSIRSCNAPEVSDGQAPPLAGQLLNGDVVSLADYQGDPVLVHFWASWCPVCELEQGGIDKVADDWPVLGVAMQSGDAAEVARYMQAQAVDYPTLLDEDGALARRFGVKGVPASFIIDAEGNIAFAQTGFLTGWGLRARLWWIDRKGP